MQSIVPVYTPLIPKVFFYLSCAGNIFGQPLKEHIQLKIARVLDTGNCHIPFILRRLVSREYHIGPEGAIIGSGPTSTIRLPSEARILASHVSIKWIPGM